MKIFAVSIFLAVSLSACVSNPNTAALTALGGVGGGVGCSHIGQGKGRIAASVGCALLGAITGNHIGSKFDAVSQNSTAITQHHLQLQRMQQQQQQQSRTGYGTQHFYMGGSSHNTHSMGMNCSVRNNYVVCNGTR